MIDAALFVVVVGSVLIALVVDVGALVSWIKGASSDYDRANRRGQTGD